MHILLFIWILFSIIDLYTLNTFRDTFKSFLKRDPEWNLKYQNFTEEEIDLALSFTIFMVSLLGPITFVIIFNGTKLS